MSRTAKLLALFALSSLVAALTACGGGGGGGGIAPVTYDGPTTQATIDGSNAADLAALSFTGSELDDVVPLAAVQAGGTITNGSAPIVQTLTDLTLRLPEQMAKLPTSSPQTAAAIPVSFTESCSPDGGATGGGTMTLSGTIDDTTFSINATITFSGCNDGETILNGPLQIVSSGIGIDPVTQDPIFDNATTTVTFLNLSIEMPATGEKITVHGTVDMTADNSGQFPVVSQTVNVTMRDDLTGETAMLQNYAVLATEATPFSQVSISGRVFSSNSGFVDLSTPTPIEIDPITDQPVSGVFRIDGAGGTWAEVDFSIDPAVADQGSHGAGLGVDSVTLGTFQI